MKYLGWLLATVTAVGQTAPTPTLVTEPVTQQVLHCPNGWHVEVWHRSISPYGGLAVETPVDQDGYRRYQKPTVITAGDDSIDKQHPPKCVADPPKAGGK